jgi:predicted nuclease with TOPRIM domain
MIVRANRSPSRFKSDEHRRFAVTIEELQRENKELRMQVLQLEQRLQESETAKKKYKMKYREAKQKVEILGLVGLARARTPEATNSPHTKNTRVKTMSQEEFTSVTANLAQSEFDDH